VGNAACRRLEDLPRLQINLHTMPRSETPGVGWISSVLIFTLLSSDVYQSSTHTNILDFGARSLQLALAAWYLTLSTLYFGCYLPTHKTRFRPDELRLPAWTFTSVNLHLVAHIDNQIEKLDSIITRPKHTVSSRSRGVLASGKPWIFKVCQRPRLPCFGS